MQAISFRPATPDDAAFLAPLVNAAGKGIPLYNWTRLASPGQDPWEVGRSRIAGTEAASSHCHATVALLDGAPAGCIFAYDQPERPSPSAVTSEMLRPLLELEALAPATRYVNILATLPAARRQGIGTALLTHAARNAAPRSMSLIVADANKAARRLYEARGYSEVARRAMVKEEWRGGGRDWILMVRPADVAAAAGR